MIPQRHTLAASRLLQKHLVPFQKSCARCLVRSVISCLELQRRGYAPLSSSTAINANPAIPGRLKELHGTLTVVRKDAAAHVNLSRLDLALRGLETESSVTRIAVLGLTNKIAARQIARLLLVDPLCEEQAWEKLLERYDNQPHRSVLLRYGENESQTSNGIVDTIHIPSPILREHNLELLVSSLNVARGSHSKALEYQNLKESALLPTVEAVRAFDGAVSFITYPVHRAFVVGEGMDGLLVLGRYATSQAGSSGHRNQIFAAAVNIDVSSPDLARPSPNNNPQVLIINTKAGLHAIEAYRESTTNTKDFEEGWFASGMPMLNEWLLNSKKSSSERQSSLFDLIQDFLEEASASLTKSEEVEKQTHSRSSQYRPFEKPLGQAIAQWASQSHFELQQTMERAATSTNWTKLRWWKLFFRADDVSSLLCDILERGWLCESEKGIMYLAGRCYEAGILREEDLVSSKPLVDVERPSNTDSNENMVTNVGASVMEAWPLFIAGKRGELIATMTAPLEALAQTLLVQTASGFAISLGASAFIYMASSSISGFEAASFAAFGIVWSLRRMQKRWDHTRVSWQAKVLEAGRATLRETENGIRMAMMETSSENAYQTQGGMLDRKSRQALDKASMALNKLR